MYDGKHTIWVIFFIAIFPLSLAVSFNTTAEVQTQKTLTNDDIVSFVKAGLSDEAIIVMIQKSQTKFDLTPDAVIKLKKTGVSNKVIETMVGGTTSTVGDSKSPLIPTAYGYYVIDEGQLLELKLTPVITKMGLEVGGRSGIGYAMDGFAGEPSLSLRSRSPIFIVYQQNIMSFESGKPVDIGSFCLSDLVYVETKQAYAFNIIGTDPKFFRNVYGRSGDDIIQIDLWRPRETTVPLRVEPVEGKSGMYRLIPQTLLSPGRYAFYIKGDIHPDGTVFAAESSRKSLAFYFKIGETLNYSKTTSKYIYETKIGDKGSKLRQITGEVIDVNAVTKTITVKGKDKEVIVGCYDETGFREGSNIRSIKVGDKVVVRYAEHGEGNIAKSIAVKEETR